MSGECFIEEDSSEEETDDIVTCAAFDRPAKRSDGIPAKAAGLPTSDNRGRIYDQSLPLGEFKPTYQSTAPPPSPLFESGSLGRDYMEYCHPRAESGPVTQDLSMSERIWNSENLMGKMAGNHGEVCQNLPAPQTSVPCQKPPPPEKETLDKQEKQDQSATAAYTDFDSEEGDSACKDGIEMWKVAKDKVKK